MMYILGGLLHFLYLPALAGSSPAFTTSLPPPSVHQPCSDRHCTWSFDVFLVGTLRQHVDSTGHKALVGHVWLWAPPGPMSAAHSCFCCRLSRLVFLGTGALQSLGCLGGYGVHTSCACYIDSWQSLMQSVYPRCGAVRVTYWSRLCCWLLLLLQHGDRPVQHLQS